MNILKFGDFITELNKQNCMHPCYKVVNASCYASTVKTHVKVEAKKPSEEYVD